MPKHKHSYSLSLRIHNLEGEKWVNRLLWCNAIEINNPSSWMMKSKYGKHAAVLLCDFQVYGLHCSQNNYLSRDANIRLEKFCKLRKHCAKCNMYFLSFEISSYLNCLSKLFTWFLDICICCSSHGLKIFKLYWIIIR